jgi:tRNA(adenine34) deaminase
MLYEQYMKLALEEAMISKQEGNKGYGAVLIKDGQIIAKAHDTVKQTGDPSSHAETNVIRLASKKFGPNLSGCTIISTCEPCPMCASTAVWAKVDTIVFGASIQETMALGRTRINVSLSELNTKAPHQIKIVNGVLKEECLKLYDY